MPRCLKATSRECASVSAATVRLVPMPGPWRPPNNWVWNQASDPGAARARTGRKAKSIDRRVPGVSANAIDPPKIPYFSKSTESNSNVPFAAPLQPQIAMSALQPSNASALTGGPSLASRL